MGSATLYRVRKRASNSIGKSTFTTRSTSSGSTLVTINGNAYRAAKEAAAKKLRDARLKHCEEEPNI